MNKTDAMCLVAIALVIIIIASALAYNWYNENYGETEKKKSKDLEVKYGVGIKFDYTLRIRTGNDISQCPVFTTTLSSVAENDSIPKTVTFSEFLKIEPDESFYPVQMIGVNDHDLIQNFGQGFYEGVLGMKQGESRTFYVKADDGPVAYSDNLIRKIPVRDSIPMFETINRSTFDSEYPYELPLSEGQSFTHNYWGWTIEVEEITNSTITIRHDPEYGMKLDLFPWNATVIEVSSEKGTIVIQHQITSEFVNTAIDAESLSKYDESFQNITQTQTELETAPLPGIITSVEDEIVIDFNQEIAGKDLIYEVKILEIEESDAYK